MKTTTIRKIALKQLAISPKNVRTAEVSEADDDMLEASIAAHGLEQNIGVEMAADNLFLVVYGGRRYRMLNRLCGKGVIDGDYKVPCRVMDEDEAFEASLAENIVRAPMHPADEFDAFDKLIGAGATERDVADRFGVALSHVQKRMKLARVSPEVLKLYRAGKMRLEVLSAFTLTTCHDKQNEVLSNVAAHLCNTWTDVPGMVRRMLTDTATPSNSRLAVFVGTDAYEAAGGKITRDLFSDTGHCYFDDAALLSRLAFSKLNEEALKLTDEWRWVEALVDVPWQQLQSYGRVYPDAIPAEPNDELNVELAAIQEKLEGLEDTGDESEETVARYEELQDRADDITALLTKPSYVYGEEARAIGGAILTLDPAGNMKLESGLVRPEDMPKANEPIDGETDPSHETTGSDDQSEGETTDREDDDVSVVATPTAAPLRITPPRPMTSAHVGADGKVDNPATAALKEAGLSAALGDDLRAIRHQVMQAHLQVDFDVSFDIVLYTMCSDTFRTTYGSKPLDLRLTPALTAASKAHLEGTVADRMIEKFRSSLRLEWMGLPKPDDFEAMSALHFSEKQALFSFAAAHVLNQQLSVDHLANPVIEEAGRRLDIDVAGCWRPTAVNFFGRVTKDYMMAAARETISDAWAEENKGMKKGNLAKSMEDAFSDEGRTRAGLRVETAKRTSQWLPDGMGFTGCQAAEPETSSDDEAGSEANGRSNVADDVETEDGAEASSFEPSDDEELPAFLTDQAA